MSEVYDIFYNIIDKDDIKTKNRFEDLFLVLLWHRTFKVPLIFKSLNYRCVCKYNIDTIFQHNILIDDFVDSTPLTKSIDSVLQELKKIVIKKPL